MFMCVCVGATGVKSVFVWVCVNGVQRSVCMINGKAAGNGEPRK